MILKKRFAASTAVYIPEYIMAQCALELDFNSAVQTWWANQHRCPEHIR
jgi:hypothetical protein